jgi:hypothetical protein
MNFYLLSAIITLINNSRGKDEARYSSKRKEVVEMLFFIGLLIALSSSIIDLINYANLLFSSLPSYLFLSGLIIIVIGGVILYKAK